jgi:hypothetical protein
LDRATGTRVTVISAPAGSRKTSLLPAWAGRPGQDRRIAFMSVKPGQHDAQLSWLAPLSAVRAAAGDAEPLPAALQFNGQAMVDKVPSELAAPGGPFVPPCAEQAQRNRVYLVTAVLPTPHLGALDPERLKYRADVDGGMSE